MNRIISFYPLENRPTLLLDLSAALQAIISQRLVRTKTGARRAAVEVLLNTRHIAELIEKGDINEIKEAMEKSMAPGSQTFEQSLFKHVHGRLDHAGRVHGERRFGHQHAVADQPGDRRRSSPARSPASAPAATRRTRRRKACCRPPAAGASFSDFKIDASA